MAEMNTDVERLERELNVKIYPGTEVMRDTAGVEFIKAGDTVLIPQPSSEPSDPLNWSPWYKAGALSSSVLLAFVQGFGPLSLSSQVPYYIESFDTTVDGVINLIGVTILVLGFSNFLWVPIATQFGRRPAAIASHLLALASSIWRAKATSYRSFLGACCLSGVACGPGETLPAMVIADVVFLHRRGFWMALQWYAYFGAQMLGPVVAGTMSDKYGWQSFWWLNAACFAFCAIWSALFQPETRFARTEAPTNASMSDIVKVEEEHVSSDVHVEKHVDAALGKGRPSRLQYKPWALHFQKEQFFRDLLTPWTLLAFPIVHWASFATSWSCSCFLVLNLTQSLVFSAPPYNFSAQSVGFTNFAVLAGATLGLLTAGPGGDWIAAFLTKRNRNIREPEFRLPALWPFCALLLLGTTITAVGYTRQWAWEIIICIGYGAIGWQVAAIPALAISYAVDCYKPVAGELLVTITINKNTWGYTAPLKAPLTGSLSLSGVSQFLVPWILKKGFLEPMMINTGLTLVFAFLGSVALMFFGKTLRRITSKSFVHKMEASAG
ncbi:hypothetical protein OIV83_005407 [Microbotryomycetes sp. JL201]|nr:hypothetical protein OIV83_005407 [Microbotryomycetes sp. JL201]